MLTIGEMSKACGVSVKTLHHYDRIGLLVPKKTDADSGYRYYDEAQIPTMLLIRRLKRYGFSLADIGVILADETQIRVQLDRQRFRLQRQVEHLSIILREMDSHIRRFERTDDIMSYQNDYKIQLEMAEAQALLTRRQKMSVEEFGTYYSAIYEKIARERLNANGVTLAIYHDMEFDPAYNDIELGVGIVEREKAELVLPARLCAGTVHMGPYSGLPDAYGAIVSWIKMNHYEMCGAPYEIYIKNQFDSLPPEQWETHIFFPVRKAE